nr:MAG TPA: hypothetical protein [Caudoviricetes sp.]
MVAILYLPPSVPTHSELRIANPQGLISLFLVFQDA